MQTKKRSHISVTPWFSVSGYQDSNLGPPAPKAGALAGLRYAPICKTTSLFNLSGYQDSNLGPPAPKAGALAGLRYAPIIAAEKGGFEPPVAFGTTTV